MVATPYVLLRSIWIFVERYLVRNFFPCNFQSSRTRSLLSLQRNKKWHFGSITSPSTIEWKRAKFKSSGNVNHTKWGPSRQPEHRRFLKIIQT